MSSLLPNGKQHFDDNNGRPLVGGRVYYYIPNTSTPKNTWQDEAMTILNTNPIVLDARGECTAWGYGTYRQVVRDFFGNLIWDRVVTDFTQKIDQSKAEVFAELADTESLSKGDALIGVRQPYEGAVAQTQHDVNSRYITPYDFGAVGDGLTDDTAAIQTAWDRASENRIRVRMTEGPYRITKELRVRSNLHVIFDEGAWLKPNVWAPSGAYITNVNPSDPLDSEVDNALLENVQLDGEDIDLEGLGNSNGIGFARGASTVRVLGAVIKNIPFSWNAPGGNGGKAINVEQGVTGFYATDVWAENCGLAVFVQGRPGVWDDGVKKNAVNIQFGNVHAEFCEGAVFCSGVDPTSDMSGDPGVMLALISNLTYHNCGHSPYRPVATDHKKSGVVVVGKGQNIRINNIVGHNDLTYPNVYPGYPTDPALIGQGLSGPIGAVVWGWGRNISIGNIEYHGDCDSLVHIERARALGDDAAPSGTPINVYRFDISELKHYGTCDYVLTKGAAFLGPDTSMTGRICVVSDVITTGFVGTDWGMTNGVTLQVRDGNTGTIVEGTPFNVRSFRNTFASTGPWPYVDTMTVREMHAARFYTETVTFANDTAVIVKPRHTAGIISIVSEASLLRVFASYRCSASGAQTANMGAAVSNFAVTTGVLTGTTGAPNTLTFSADSAGNLYLENRRGATITLTYGFFG